MRGRSHWSKYGDRCINCNKTDKESKLTRHHILTDDGKRNGKVVVLCLECHHKEHEKNDGKCRYESLTQQLSYYKTRFFHYRDLYLNQKKLGDGKVIIRKKDLEKLIKKAGKKMTKEKTKIEQTD